MIPQVNWHLSWLFSQFLIFSKSVSYIPSSYLIWGMCESFVGEEWKLVVFVHVLWLGFIWCVVCRNATRIYNNSTCTCFVLHRCTGTVIVSYHTQLLVLRASFVWFPQHGCTYTVLLCTTRSCGTQYLLYFLVQSLVYCTRGSYGWYSISICLLFALMTLFLLRRFTFVVYF